MYALAHLLVLLAATTMMMFALSVLLVTAVNSLMFNTMMIEHWEIERHEALIERARYMGGFVYGPGGIRVRIKRQEFPYDIGIWKNIVQGMGTNNVLAWVLPWGGGPSSDAGWAFETNGFEDEGTTWPPIDPDKMPRPSRGNYEDGEQAFVHDVDVDVDEDIQAFRRRQEADLQRFRQPSGAEIRQREIEKSTDLNEGGEYELDEDYESEYEEGADGQEGWTSSDGTRLRDFGVDEEAELLDDDDIPLGELLRRRRFVATEEE
jgi:palmitoyltransferase